MKKRTAYALAQEVIRENRPFDYRWLRHLSRTLTNKQLLDWARENIEDYATDNDSKQLRGRAAKILLEEVMNEVY